MLLPLVKSFFIMSRRFHSSKYGQSVHLFFGCPSLTDNAFPQPNTPFKYFQKYIIVPENDIQGVREISSLSLNFAFRCSPGSNITSVRWLLVKLPRGYVIGPSNFYIPDTSYDFQPQNSIVFSGVVCTDIGTNLFYSKNKIQIESDESLSFILLTNNNDQINTSDMFTYVDCSFNISY